MACLDAHLYEIEYKSYPLHEWCDLNRLSNAYFDAKLKKKKHLYSLFNEFVSLEFW
jgi:hypothetical protein